MTLHVEEMAEQRRRSYAGRVYGVLGKEFGIKSRETNFEMDSLDSTAFVIGLEDEFGINISDEDATRLVGEVPFNLMGFSKRQSQVSVVQVVDYLAGREDAK